MLQIFFSLGIALNYVGVMSLKLNLNNGDEYVRLTGIIRPNDISAANLVDSSRIANAEITYVGAGQVADTGKKGWLSNAMRTISPF